MTASEIEGPSLTVLWRIENFGLLEKQEDSWAFVSPFIDSRILEGEAFALNLCTNGANCIDLVLGLRKDSPNLRIDYEWSILDIYGSVLVRGSDRNRILGPTLLNDVNAFPTLEDLFVTRKSEFLPHGTLTLRFRICRSGENLLNEELIFCRTQLSTVERSFTWQISNFSTLDLNYTVTTPIKLSDSIDAENKLDLMFSFNGEYLDSSYVSVKLIPHGFFSLNCNAKLKLTVLNNEQKPLKCVESNSEFILASLNEAVVVQKLMSRRDIIKKESECLDNDVLTLYCEISSIRFNDIIERTYYGLPNLEMNNSETFFRLLDVGHQTKQQTVDPLEIPFQERHSLTPLAKDFLNLYQDQNLTDFKIQSGTVSIPVHKVVLSARSPVFKAMFSSDMKESGCDSLDVPDVDAHSLNRMLTFLYTGTLEPDLRWESAAKLYYAADKYQVQSLKQDCSSILRSEVSVSNVSDILTLADTHQDEELTSFLHDFVISLFDDVMNSKEWESFMVSDPAFAGKTVFELVKKKQSKRP